MERDLDLLSKLVGIDTNCNEQKNYDQIALILKEALNDAGARTIIVHAKAKDGNSRPNVIGYFDNGKDDTLGINAHFDVVPATRQEWRRNPFELYISGDKAFGRGAADDKGNIVASLLAASGSRSRVNIELLYTCDEEVGSEYGLAWIMKNRRRLVRSNYAVVLDGRMRLIGGTSGVASGTITVRGKESHAGYPFLGRNAILSAMPFLQKLQEFEKVAGTKTSRYSGIYGKKINGRFSITTIKSGSGNNIIPGLLNAGFDMRSPPGYEIEKMSAEFKKYFNLWSKRFGVDASLDFVGLTPGYESNQNSKIMMKMMQITGMEKIYGAYGGDDGGYLSNAGIPTVSYGCLNASVHGPNEYVSIRELRKVKEVMTHLFEKF